MMVRRFVGLLFVLFCSIPQVGMAQGFDLQKFRPAQSPNALFSQEAADTTGHLTPTGGLLLNFGSAPLVRVAGDDVTETFVEQQLALHLLGGLGVTDYLEFGIDFPVYLVNDGMTLGGAPVEGIEVGDLRLRSKGRLLSSLEGGLGLGLLLDLGLPTGADEAYVGAGSVTAVPKVIADYRLGRLLVALNVGADLGASTTVEDLELGNSLVYGGGAELQFLRGLLYLTGEVYGTTPFEDLFGEDVSPLEGLIGAKVASDRGFQVTIAMGGGLVPGAGSTEFRSILGVQYAERTLDFDGDGIENRDDQCPAEAEDLDGFEDSDGCPDPDNDADGIADSVDACPDEPEDSDDFEDDDGCPDPDNDQDGIPDVDDTCPTEAEDPDGVQDSDGCPDRDNDQDGIPDGEDECPDTAEDPDGFEDADGCPDLDNDLDGIPDAEDACPDEPGLAENRGCPSEAPKAVREKDAITILEKVYFETGKAKIEQRSFNLLDEVALILRSNPDIELVEVAGHTDDRGSEEDNMVLSQNRAESVVSYLVARGIDASRLVAKGYGESKPVDERGNRVARAKNRRVEFNILEQEGVTGAEAAEGAAAEEPAEEPSEEPSEEPATAE